MNSSTYDKENVPSGTIPTSDTKDSIQGNRRRSIGDISTDDGNFLKDSPMTKISDEAETPRSLRAKRRSILVAHSATDSPSRRRKSIGRRVSFAPEVSEGLLNIAEDPANEEKASNEAISASSKTSSADLSAFRQQVRDTVSKRYASRSLDDYVAELTSSIDTAEKDTESRRSSGISLDPMSITADLDLEEYLPRASAPIWLSSISSENSRMHSQNRRMSSSSENHINPDEVTAVLSAADELLTSLDVSEFDISMFSNSDPNDEYLAESNTTDMDMTMCVGGILDVNVASSPSSLSLKKLDESDMDLTVAVGRILEQRTDSDKDSVTSSEESGTVEGDAMDITQSYGKILELAGKKLPPSSSTPKALNLRRRSSISGSSSRLRNRLSISSSTFGRSRKSLLVSQPVLLESPDQHEDSDSEMELTQAYGGILSSSEQSSEKISDGTTSGIHEYLPASQDSMDSSCMDLDESLDGPMNIHILAFREIEETTHLSNNDKLAEDTIHSKKSFSSPLKVSLGRENSAKVENLSTPIRESSTLPTADSTPLLSASKSLQDIKRSVEKIRNDRLTPKSERVARILALEEETTGMKSNEDINKTLADIFAAATPCRDASLIHRSTLESDDELTDSSSMRMSLGSYASVEENPAEKWTVDEFFAKADLRFPIDELLKRRATSFGPGSVGLMDRSFQVLNTQEKLVTASFIYPCSDHIQRNCEYLEVQTEEMRNEIETIQAALNASHPIIYEELDEVLGTSAEDEIQGLLQTLKSKCREKSLCTWSEWNAKSQRSLRGVGSSGEPCGGLFDTMLSLEKYADHVKTLLADVLAMKVDIQDQREQIQQEASIISSENMKCATTCKNIEEKRSEESALRKRIEDLDRLLQAEQSRGDALLQKKSSIEKSIDEEDVRLHEDARQMRNVSQRRAYLKYSVETCLRHGFAHCEVESIENTSISFLIRYSDSKNLPICRGVVNLCPDSESFGSVLLSNCTPSKLNRFQRSFGDFISAYLNRFFENVRFFSSLSQNIPQIVSIIINHCSWYMESMQSFLNECFLVQSKFSDIQLELITPQNELMDIMLLIELCNIEKESKLQLLLPIRPMNSTEERLVGPIGSERSVELSIFFGEFSQNQITAMVMMARSIFSLCQNLQSLTQACS